MWEDENAEVVFCSSLLQNKLFILDLRYQEKVKRVVAMA